MSVPPGSGRATRSSRTPVGRSSTAAAEPSYERAAPEPSGRAKPQIRPGDTVFGTDRARQPEEAIGIVDDLKPVQPLNGRAAPVEDVLAHLLARLDRPRWERKVALVTVGERGPHVPRAEPSTVLPCPGRHDWRVLLERLSERGDFVCAAIVDQLPTEEDDPWHQLGERMVEQVDFDDGRELANGLGLITQPVQPVIFPIADWDDVR